MPEFVALDEIPSEPDQSPFGTEGDKVSCPECGDYFNPRGLKRHITMSHRGGVSDTPRNSTKKTGSRVQVTLAQRWCEFQQGAAVLVSLACADCGTALVEDAEKDGAAIAAFCVNRPKLRKQLEDALSGMDFMLLVGALGSTATKMVGHHSIGKRIGLPGGSSPQHNAEHDAAARMMGFMSRLPQEQRNDLLNKVFEAQSRNDEAAQAQAPQADDAPPQTAPVRPVEYSYPENAGAGAEPNPEQVIQDEHDAAMIAAAHAGSDFMATV